MKKCHGTIAAAGMLIFGISQANAQAASVTCVPSEVHSGAAAVHFFCNNQWYGIANSDLAFISDVLLVR